MMNPIYKATPDTLTEGQRTSGVADAAGNLLVAIGSGDAALSAAIGSTDDAAWDGMDADATVISLLKAIALNTTPAP